MVEIDQKQHLIKIKNRGEIPRFVADLKLSNHIQRAKALLPG